MVGNLYMPSTMAKDQFPEAKVISVGPKCVDVKVGDTVIIDRYAMVSQRVQIKGKLHFVISEPEILAIVN